MATTYKVLGQTNAVRDYISALYTVPSSVSTLVSTIIICNQGAGTATFNICIQPAGADISTKHYLSYNTSIAAYDTIPLTLGLTLGPNDVISVWANSDTVSFGAFGAELTLATGEGPVISNFYVTDGSYNVTSATSVALTGGYIKLTGSGFITGAAVYVDTTTATSSLVVNSTEIWSQVPAATSGTHMLTMFNPSGTGSRYPLGISYSPVPVWTTATYSTNSTTNISVQLLATGDVPLTYSIMSGSSLPSGLSMSSSGLVTGSTSVGSYSFYAVVSDLQNQTVTQQITLSVFLIPVEYIIVAGGAGGGFYNGGGGGGAGGLLTGLVSTIQRSTLYTVTVGTGGPGSASVNAYGSNGTPSVFNSISTVGGGGAGSGDGTAYNGQLGGSGGGGASTGGTNGTGGAGTAGQGNAGGVGNTDGGISYRVGGGGGGAGMAGGAGTTNGGGAGGTGTFTTLISTTTGISLSIGQYVTATNAIYFAGGGGGAGYANPRFGGLGGPGGGGNGVITGPAGNGSPNSGGGGGGIINAGGATAGGNGGSGVVVLRHTTVYSSATSTTGTVSIVNTGGYWIYAFKSSGSIQW